MLSGIEIFNFFVSDHLKIVKRNPKYSFLNTLSTGYLGFLTILIMRYSNSFLVSAKILSSMRKEQQQPHRLLDFVKVLSKPLVTRFCLSVLKENRNTKTS